MGRIKVLDPACGSGNFLTEAFCSLRRLENVCLRKLEALGELDRIEGQGEEYIEAELKSRIKLDNFYGIEINDFACTVARAAMWIAEEKMYMNYEGKSAFKANHLPLKDTSGNIICGNALQMNWEEIVPKEELTYIIGNPPFVGSKLQDSDQKKDLQTVIGGKRWNSCDYVLGWFYKAIKLIQDSSIHIAFVATDAISRGLMNKYFFEESIKGLSAYICFAYQPFPWESEADKTAQVNVVIMSISSKEPQECVLYSGAAERKVKRINYKLEEGEDFYIEKRSSPLCDIPIMVNGANTTDGGYLKLGYSDYISICEKYPELKKYILPSFSGAELLQKEQQYRFFFPENVQEELFNNYPEVKARLASVNFFRDGGIVEQLNPWVYKGHKTFNGGFATLMNHADQYNDHIIFVKIPFSFIENTIEAVESDNIELFGLLSSKLFYLWCKSYGLYGKMLQIRGYSYNSFPFILNGNLEIIRSATSILKDREMCNESLKDHYHNKTISEETKQLFINLDHAVMDAYNFKHTDGTYFNDDEILSGLISLYKEAIDKERSQQ